MCVQRQGRWVRMPARVANSVTAMQTFLSLQTDSSSIFKKSSFKSQRLLGLPCVTLKSEDFSGPERNLEVNTSAIPSKPCRRG